MRISDWINVALCILSFLLAVISVITVVITLRQNQRMIENATRPYVTLYGVFTAYDVSIFYLVLRNFGQSSATIKDISCNLDLSKLTFTDFFSTPFSKITGFRLAPGRSIRVPIQHIPLNNADLPLSFVIKYESDSRNEYEESVDIDIQSFADQPVLHASQNADPVQVVANTLHDIAVSQL